MLYRPPKGTQQASKSKRKRPLVRLEVRDAFEFLAKLKPGTVDLIVSSPPYCMGKEYDTSVNVDDFVADHEKLAPLLIRALKDGGSLCWQIGHHVRNGVTIPLDAIVYSIFAKHEELLLRNRIVWTFGHGVHASRRFSGRHETIFGSRRATTTNSISTRCECPRNTLASGTTKDRAKANSAAIHLARSF